VQRMTAGKGIMHSEFNKGKEDLHLYQIWIFPESQGLTPSYEQKSFDLKSHKNKLLPVVTPKGSEEALLIHQDAKIYLGDFEPGKSQNYATTPERKIFIYITSGKLKVNNEVLAKNDQARISGESTLNLEALEETEFVLIDARDL